jgi:hypothetical protein
MQGDAAMGRLRMLALVAVMAMAGCGGGGGGGGGGPGEPQVEPLAYEGNLLPAVITTRNAARLVSATIGAGPDDTVTGAVDAAKSARTDRAVTPRVGVVLDGWLRPFFDRLGAASSAGPATKTAIDETQPCPAGGTLRVSGDVDDDGRGTVTADYRDCGVGDARLAGSMTIRIDGITPTGVPTDATITFPRLQYVGPEGRATLGGRVHDRFDVATRTSTLVEDVVVRDDGTGTMTWSRDVTTVIVHPYEAPTRWGSRETVTGRVYHSIDGYVDLSTPSPLTYRVSEQQVHPDSGQALLAGAGNAGIRVTALSERLARIEVDPSGLGSWPVVATLGWSQLDGPGGSELADSDGDGMHDGWEVLHGLDRNSAADASTDLDGDGVPNGVEYARGTSPSDASDRPPIADLRILWVAASPLVVPPGGETLLTVSIDNRGPSRATGTRLALDLPAGATLLAGEVQTGPTFAGMRPVVCGGALGAACEIDVLPAPGEPGAGVMVLSLRMSIGAAGLQHLSLRVTSDGYDATPPDATRTVTLLAAVPSAGLQALVDAAPSGGTVRVPPGVWAGPVDLGAKDVIVAGDAGPSRTIVVAPGGGHAFRVAGNGIVQGFTIVSDGGHGVLVEGAGAAVIANVFDGGQYPGVAGFASAIGGPGMPARVEANVFRFNRCSGGSGATRNGLVVALSGQTPAPPMRIASNVFADNACAGVVTGYAAAPSVLSNTFVGNDVGLLLVQPLAPLQAVFRNNIVSGNAVGVGKDGGLPVDDLDWRNNLVHGNGVDWSNLPDRTGSFDNLSADPLLADPARGDWRPRPGSPAVDAADPATAPSVDAAGVLRPIDGDGDGVALPDIGAFELVR